jgi:hypothetical protein
LSDVIEAGSTSGWHTFEQSLIKAFEERLISEETALLYCVNRNQMRQRIDAVQKRRDSGPGASTLKMKSVEEAPKPRPVAPPPLAQTPAPAMPGMQPSEPAPAGMRPMQMNPTTSVSAQPKAPSQPATVVSSIPLQMKP